MTLDLSKGCALARLVREGAVTAAEVVETSLARIDAVNPRVDAFIEVYHEQARAAATRLDRRLRGAGVDSSTLPLAGVPYALKDNFARRGDVTTCGSRILEGFVSPYTATAVAALEAAGAICVGRTNMDEMAMGSSTEHSCYGPTRNPFDLTRIPGGSSGGSAAAVAARMVPIALGSDTGGSVRQPAAMCGISGLKPTYGRISRHGLVAYAGSLDTVAPFAVEAEDLAAVLAVLAGPDPQDSTSSAVPPPRATLVPRDLRGLRVGIPEEFFTAGLEAGVLACVEANLEALTEAGAVRVPLSLPHTRHAIPTYYLIAMAEASSALARFDGIHFGPRDAPRGPGESVHARTRSDRFGAEVQRRLELGAWTLRAGFRDAWYQQAQRVRTRIRREFEAAFTRCDVLATATSPVPAFPLGERVDDPLAMYLCDVLTTPANLAGIPALSVPAGVQDEGLPVGLQLMAPDHGESTLLAVAATLTAATSAHRREPDL